MAYACLTFLEKSAVNRRAAAKQYNIDEEIFRKMGEISSTRGDTLTARKFEKEGIERPLSHVEAIWDRSSNQGSDPPGRRNSLELPPQTLKMCDLPPI